MRICYRLQGDFKLPKLRVDFRIRVVNKNKKKYHLYDVYYNGLKNHSVESIQAMTFATQWKKTRCGQTYVRSIKPTCKLYV